MSSPLRLAARVRKSRQDSKGTVTEIPCSVYALGPWNATPRSSFETSVFVSVFVEA